MFYDLTVDFCFNFISSVPGNGITFYNDFWLLARCEEKLKGNWLMKYKTEQMVQLLKAP